MNNPFELVSASKLSAKEAIQLWCDDSRLDRVRGGESCFISGNRGTGKSMLFRVLQRDCQELLHPDGQPGFLSVYFSVRDSDLMVEEFLLIQSHHQKSVLSESHLVLLLVRQLIVELFKYPSFVPSSTRDAFIQLLADRIKLAFDFSGVEAPVFPTLDFDQAMRSVIRELDIECTRLVNHVLRQLDGPEGGYTGPLFLFDGLLGPVADFLMETTGCRLFLLIDDADDLPESHTIVLNSWIARRRSSAVFKVSTMYAYKTFTTRSGSKIQHPHDFTQYDIASRFIEYESEDYVDLLKHICERRLLQARLTDKDGNSVNDPELFFPRDQGQAKRLEELQSSLAKRYETLFKGRAVRDNVYRHLTSEYMKVLNKGRSGGTFSYAGFRTLAILSGGLVRDFIICAQRMYDDAQRRAEYGIVERIPPSIQSQVVRNYADSILSEVGEAHQKRAGTHEDWKAIDNIVNGLGGAFRRKMFSDDSERRVFSFAFQTQPSETLLRLFDLAVAEGYFVRGFISKKEGIGRRRLYVLTRRVCPAFSLDVSAYNGYLSLEPSALEQVARQGGEFGKTLKDAQQQELPLGSIGPDGEWEFTEPDGREAW